MVVKAS